MATVNIPDDPALAIEVLKQQGEKSARPWEYGALGWLFGSGPQKPGNIAGGTVIACFALVFFVIYAPTDPSLPKKDLVFSLVSIISGSLGFLFGRTSSDKGPSSRR